ncbi:hypothetical protein K378_05128 [Streptomyces sp. Amel2xB2]|uniref:trypco2 family protein n=1 Tax=Streptomyces sp. Amel2xB2 TaxID=1305829 RepID=UPI000DB92732|nr:trypco2 family protein [Streptomyces sp. Amel2xB2]RAJ58894.1 hypothetical protein K378_05128 [Streptomyces sp. Amel2xB2]
MPDSDSVELTTAVQAIRDQLTHAAEATADEPLRFDVGEIQMEFAVELRQDAAAKGGFKAWVLSADAEAKAGRSRTHRVSFTLTPRNAATGDGLRIGNETPGGTDGFGHAGP